MLWHTVMQLQGYWLGLALKNPRLCLCLPACDCDPRGIATPKCNKMTGQCACVEGVAGQRCDSCGRGYMGTFPDCQPCHQCFSDWDVTVGELTNQTQRLVDNVDELKVSGVTAAYQDTISSLEGKAKQLTKIIEDNKAQQTFKHSRNLLQQAKYVLKCTHIQGTCIYHNHIYFEIIFYFLSFL